MTHTGTGWSAQTGPARALAHPDDTAAASARRTPRDRRSYPRSSVSGGLMFGRITPLSIVRRAAAVGAVVILVATTNLAPEASAHPNTSTFRFRAVDGQTYSITNHITREIRRELAHGTRRHEWMLVWAG